MDLYRQLNAEFDLTFDPCPIDPKFDGLSVPWGKRTFANPPYGRTLGRWTHKAYRESPRGKLVVLLIPARTDTAWWHDDVMQADEIRFLRGRLRFDDGNGRATFPSAIVIFRGRKST